MWLYFDAFLALCMEIPKNRQQTVLHVVQFDSCLSLRYTGLLCLNRQLAAEFNEFLSGKFYDKTRIYHHY